MSGTFYSPGDLAALWISVRLALITSLSLLILGTPLAWWLASGRSRLRVVIEAVTALPLVLPPTVLGFYLLMFLGPYGWAGRTMLRFGLHPLAFSFGGLVAGSMIYSTPFVVQPLQTAFQAVGIRSLEVAATLRAGPFDRFLSVVLPLARRGFVTGAALAFAHTLGEFGIVLMLGGNIPGRTQTAAIAIYSHVEVLDYVGAQRLSVTLLLICFVLLLIVYATQRGSRRDWAVV